MKRFLLFVLIAFAANVGTIFTASSQSLYETFEPNEGQTLGHFQFLRRNCWILRGISYQYRDGIEGNSIQTGVLRRQIVRSITTSNVFVRRGDSLYFQFRSNGFLKNGQNAHMLVQLLNYEGGVMWQDSVAFHNDHNEVSNYIHTWGQSFGFARIRLLFRGQSRITVTIDNIRFTGRYLQCQNCLPIATPVVQNVSRCGSGPVFIPAPGGNLSEYIWYDANMNRIPNQNGAGLLVNISTTTSYYVSIKRNACQSPPAKVVATVIPQPQPPTVLGGNHCGPGSVTLQAFGGEDGNYRWYATNELSSLIPGAVNSQYVTPPLDSTKTYYVAIANGSCLSWRRAVTAQITQFTPYYEVEQLNPTLFRYRAFPAGGQYQWYSGADSIPGAVWQVFTTSLPNIVVRVSVNSCVKYYPHPPGGRFAVELDNQSINTSLKPSIYPNPVKHQLYINLPGTGGQRQVHIKIVDIMGKTCYDHTVANFTEPFTHAVDVNHLNKGIYLLVLADENGQSVHRIMIE